MQTNHSFHIPVLGIGFSVDTPVKVAQFGITSVISLVDDELAEELRAYYLKARGETYEPIDKTYDNPRAARFTAYLNLVNTMVQEKTEQLRKTEFEPGSEITRYFEYLPNGSPLRQRYEDMLSADSAAERDQIQAELRDAIRPGEVETNIMVKVDSDRYRDGEQLPPEYADAMSALQGFAESELESGVVLSAGFNRRLAKHIENFADFHADAAGNFRKKIILKVSDFRSAQTQAKMFARSGLWISEFRIESGLNCGGHTFATDGILLGPILEDFKTRREELFESTYEVYRAAVIKRTSSEPQRPSFRVTVQGGVGTALEHNFLMDNYEIDAVGWGSPFLLVPEAVNIDDDTLNKLAIAGAEDIVSSGASPLGVRFSNLMNSAAELYKRRLIREEKPGSPCPKGYLKFNTEFTDRAICVASNAYQKRKIAEIDELGLESSERERRYNEIVERACICRDLSGSVEILYGTGRYGKDATPAVCPGPNLAFFPRAAKLQEMIDHIYGRLDLLNGIDRPHIFVNELKLYVAHLAEGLAEAMRSGSEAGAEAFRSYRDNLLTGIGYYLGLMSTLGEDYRRWKERVPSELLKLKEQIETIMVVLPETAERNEG